MELFLEFIKILKDDMPTYAQYELKEDEKVYIFKLGFSVNEVKELIGE